MRFKYEGLVLLIAIVFLLRTCQKQKPIFSENYQAIKCGLSSNNSTKDTFIFDKENGYLYYFDVDEDRFLPIPKKVTKLIDEFQNKKIHSGELRPGVGFG